MCYLIVLFIAIPFIELMLLFYLEDHVGAMWTLGIIVFTGVLGAALARWQGWRTFVRIQDELRNQRMPSDSLADAGMIFVAGALLLTPGILTDLFGFSLLVPVFRRFYRGAIVKWARKKIHIQTTIHRAGSRRHARQDEPDDHNIVDGHVVRPGTGKPSATNPSTLENRDVP